MGLSYTTAITSPTAFTTPEENTGYTLASPRFRLVPVRESENASMRRQGLDGLSGRCRVAPPWHSASVLELSLGWPLRLPLAGLGLQVGFHHHLH